MKIKIEYEIAKDCWHCPQRKYIVDECGITDLYCKVLDKGIDTHKKDTIRLKQCLDNEVEGT